MTDRPVALVTGASRGIGAAVARQLAADGYDVALTCVSNTAQAEQVARQCQESGVQTLVLTGDLTQESLCKDIAEKVHAHFGCIDLLVNNAGITRDGLLVRMTGAQWEDVLSANLSSAFYMMRYVTAFMFKARRGKVINMASVAGVMGNPGQVNYSASKAGLIGMTKAAAKELGARGITVNAVAPGLIQTDMTQGLNEKAVEAILSRVPLGRMGQAQEVAHLVSFLASSKADYITGQVLSIDGGMA